MSLTTRILLTMGVAGPLAVQIAEDFGRSVVIYTCGGLVLIAALIEAKGWLDRRQVGVKKRGMING